MHILYRYLLFTIQPLFHFLPPPVLPSPSSCHPPYPLPLSFYSEDNRPPMDSNQK